MGAQEPWLCQRVLSWWTLKQRMSLLHSLSRGTITNAVFLGREQNSVRCLGFFLQANRRVSLLQLYSWQRDVSSKIHYPVAADQSNSLKSWVLSLTGCNNKGPFSSASVCQTTEVSTPFLMQSQDAHRQMITVAVGQPIALSSGCCPRLCL